MSAAVPEGIPEVLAVIPARFASTRFPGKVIAPLAGKPMVLHTYERTCAATRVTEVVVAADDKRVVEALAPFGIRVVMTRADHVSGTDRAAEVAATSSAQLIVNVQADEPLIDPRTIDAAIAPMLDDSELAMVTVKHRITDLTEVTDPNVVKVVCDANGRALYFSRSPIPHIRDAADRATAPAFYWKHLGLYVYRREFLLAYAGLPRTPLEQLERLEQLRALENGCAVAVVETPYDSIGVDTPEDLARVAALLGRQTVGRSD